MTGPAVQVMVVEDDEDIRDVLMILLTSHGFATAVAKDGLNALEQLRSGPPPLVILVDLMMPTLDGEGLVHAIRADTGLAEIPLVIMSGHNSAREKAAELAAADVLVKPIELDQVVSVIRRLIVQHSST